jgi:hypothetical protein
MDDDEDARPYPDADTASTFSSPLLQSGADFENASDLRKCNSIDPALSGIYCLSWHDGLTGCYKDVDRSFVGYIHDSPDESAWSKIELRSTDDGEVVVTRDLEPCAPHNWALVCFDDRGRSDRGIDYHCTSSLAVYVSLHFSLLTLTETQAIKGPQFCDTDGDVCCIVDAVYLCLTNPKADDCSILRPRNL